MEKIWFAAWEEKFIIWLQSTGSESFLQTVLVILNNFFSMFGEEYICIAVLGLVYFGIDKKKGRKIGLIIIFTNIFVGMVKNIFCRLRPWQCSEKIELLRDVDGYSFPSGHSANAGALYPALAYEFRKKSLIAASIIIPLFVGISRIYLGAHWPTDVLCGLASGLFVLILCELAFKKTDNIFVLSGIMLVMASAGLFYCKTDDFFKAYGMLLGFIGAVKMDESFIHFKNTDKLWIMLLRTAGGMILFVIMNPLLKILQGLIADPETMLNNYLHIVRYAMNLFVVTGVYPMLFGPFEKKVLKA